MKKEGPVIIVFFIVFVGLALLTLYIIQGFVQALMAAAVLAYIFYPIYKRVRDRTKLPSLSAILVSLLVLVVLLVPVIFVVDNAADEARFVYVRALQVIQTGKLIEGQCMPPQSSLCAAFDSVGAFISNQQVQVYLQDGISKVTTFVITKVTSLLLALPSILLNVLITFFSLYYLFKDGPRLVSHFKRLLPVPKKHQEHIIAKLGEVTYALVYGSLVIAIVQGILGGIAFWLIGIQSPVIWGMVMAIFAVIPFLGTGIIWGPTGIYLLLVGLSQGDSILAYKGIALLIFGLLFISTIDNFLKPRIIGDRTGLHPVLILVGILGGLAAFGIVGFVVGPLVIALLKSIVNIYEAEVSHT